MGEGGVDDLVELFGGEGQREERLFEGSGEELGAGVVAFSVVGFGGVVGRRLGMGLETKIIEDLPLEAVSLFVDGHEAL